MINQYKLNIFIPVFNAILERDDLKSIVRARSKNEANEIVYSALASGVLKKTGSEFGIIKNLIEQANKPEHEIQFFMNALNQVMQLDDSHPFKTALRKSIGVSFVNYAFTFFEMGLIAETLIDVTLFNPILSLSNCLRLLTILGIERFTQNLNDTYTMSTVMGNRFELDAENSYATLIKVYKDLTGIRDLATLKGYVSNVFESTAEFAKTNFSFFYNKLTASPSVEQRSQIFSSAEIFEDYTGPNRSTP